MCADQFNLGEDKMDPNTDDLKLLNLLNKELMQVFSEADGSYLIATNSIPQALQNLFIEENPNVTFPGIDKERHITLKDWESFQSTKINEIIDRMQERSLELGLAGPSSDDLDDAPTLTHWIAIQDPEYGGAVLLGTPIGHPTCIGPLTRTSRLCRLDEAGTWARTASRWYRLSVPETADTMFERHGERVAGIGGLALKMWQVQARIADDQERAGFK